MTRTSRRIYVIDLDTGLAVKTVDVTGWPLGKITALERELLAQCGEDMAVRDSALDRD